MEMPRFAQHDPSSIYVNINRGGNMKILIAADMEGVSGVTHGDQTTPGHSEYARFRKIMTADVNAAIRGAFEAGADEVLVTDGHWDGVNLLIEELDTRARLNAGLGSPFSMVQGVEDGIDGVFFIGYHACAGSKNAVLDHTWSDAVAGLWLNERLVGETGLNAAVCGYFDAPVALVSGDQTVCGEARDLLGSIEVAVVKRATGHLSAECLPLELAQDKICEGAVRATMRLKAGEFKPFKLDHPIKVRLEFAYAAMADQASLLPGVQRLDGKTIAWNADQPAAAFTSFRAAVSLAH
jgi:D-amino peptidase